MFSSSGERPRAAAAVSGRGEGQALQAVLASILGCTAGILLLDALFRQSLTPAYVSGFVGPYGWARTALYIAKATGDEVERFFIQGAMMSIATRAAATRPVGIAASTALIALTHALIVVPQLATPPNLNQWVYDGLRFGGPGILWGWLLMRHGFAAAVLGHTMTHPLLDPLLNALLSRPHA